jgi:glycerophosphoryl diester phosphodiesterase
MGKWVVPVIAALSACRPVAATRPVDDRWARCAPAIAHGMGAIGDQLYSNSREAFLRQYTRGFRVFEVDLNTTTDGALVAAHDWYTPSRMNGLRGRPSSAEFARWRIAGRYTPLRGSDLIELLRTHPDVRLVLDLKGDPPKLLKQLLGDMTSRDSLIAGRLIPLVREAEDVPRLTGIYPFPSVMWAIYWTRASDAQVLQRVRQYQIGLVTMSRFRATPAFLRRLQQSGVVVYISEVNTELQADLYREWGARGILTDILDPDSTCVPSSP